MKKQEQRFENECCMKAMNIYNKYVDDHNPTFEWERLDYCTAWVADVGEYKVLLSYKTIIAIIHKPTGTMYDLLRYVYGYTKASGRHIAKFRRYANNYLIYRPV